MNPGFDVVKFTIGQTVYYRPKPERTGIVCQIIFSAAGIRYTVSWDDFVDRSHYDVELSAEKSFSSP